MGLALMTACEMQSDGGELEPSIATTLDVELEAVLDLMSDDPDEAIAKCDEIIKKAQSASSSYYMGKALWYQAYIYDDILEDVSKAYFGYNEALKHLKQTDDATAIVKASTNLAILNQYYGQHDMAIDIYEQNLDYKDDISDKLLSDNYYNLGRSYKLKGDKESFYKAEEAFTKSLEVARKIEDHENIASVNNQVGLMYKDLGNYDMSRIAYKNTIKTYQHEDKSSELLEYVGRAYHGIGVTHMEEENYPEAIAAFEEALLYEKNSGTLFITKYDLGTVLHEAGHVDKAVATWKNALTEKHNKNDRIEVEIYAKLTSALAASEAYEEAVNYAQLYNEQIGNILSVRDKYKSENNEVIFADIIREYEEFNRVIPLYRQLGLLSYWCFLLLLWSTGLALGTTDLRYLRKCQKP